MTVGPGRPAWLVEDPAWLPDDDMFSRYATGSDLGLLFTDGEYDVVVFETIGPPAVETFDALRLGLGPTGSPVRSAREFLASGATDTERLDDDRPLLVLARRGSDQPFAAIQDWELLEQLVKQDRPRRERGEPPEPRIVDKVEVRSRGALGWMVRGTLVLAAMTVGGLLGLLAVDAEGPIGHRVRDGSTAANPLPTGARLIVVSGAQEQALPILRARSADVTPLSQVRWSLDTPLTITYWPGSLTDERHSVTLDLRDAGATALNRGWYVVVDLDVSDDSAVLRITQPTQRRLNLERTTVYEVTLARRTADGSVNSSPREGTDHTECVQDETDRYLPLQETLDLVARYEAAEREYLADGSISDSEASNLARRMRQHASDLEEALFGSGLLASRPSESQLPALFERMLLLQQELSAAWEIPDTDRINAVYSEFTGSAAFLGGFSTYLSEDATLICASAGPTPRP
jgi:hypothetical protein